MYPKACASIIIYKLSRCSSESSYKCVGIFRRQQTREEAEQKLSASAFLSAVRLAASSGSARCSLCAYVVNSNWGPFAAGGLNYQHRVHYIMRPQFINSLFSPLLTAVESGLR